MSVGFRAGLWDSVEDKPKGSFSCSSKNKNVSFNQVGALHGGLENRRHSQMEYCGQLSCSLYRCCAIIWIWDVCALLAAVLMHNNILLYAS
jgi:hypothetical protein